MMRTDTSLIAYTGRCWFDSQRGFGAAGLTRKYQALDGSYRERQTTNSQSWLFRNDFLDQEPGK